MRAGLSGYSPSCSLSCGSGMQPTSARPVGVTGSTDSENSGTDAGSGAGSGEATGGAATDDPSWGGAVDGAGVRTGHRNARTLWLRQADRQLCGAGAVGGVQRGSATAGPHQQTGQLSAAFSAGGSSSGDGPHGPRLAAPAAPPGPATRETDCQGSHGA